ncbi:unnamed protein product [Ostreobium quekettii]|uniref:glutathione dehydrogenase (ascorbate) n=1 Tax=Ostreobium quekettii TaxID=121088 RepID=A0A8S1IQL0_9CHLO|nr:unnamed protein product [Ostreobium quekettii]|eukprot:evm.model.scf_311.6 EVM.evm.TU.scf_311.6   scf_311:81595-82263(+)
MASASGEGSKPVLTAYVKGDPATSTLGDCPFCHRVLLTLREKAIPHDLQYIAFDNKPDWLLDVNPSGTVPVIKHGDAWVPDSGAIVAYLEEKFPEPSMVAPAEMAEVGGSVFGSFRAFALPGDADPAEAEAKWLGEMGDLDKVLKATEGPFLGGDRFNSVDVMLLPRLYHAFTVLKHFKGWELPEEYGTVAAYFGEAKGRDSWKATDYGEEMILKGWAPKFA